MNQFFSDAKRILEAPQSAPLVLQRLARAAVPSIADFCLIFLATNGSVRCVAGAHRTRRGERLLRGLNRIYRVRRTDPVSTVAHVIRTGRPTLRLSIAREVTRPVADFQVFTIHDRLGARSALVVPIGAPPYVRGAISLSYADSGRQYSAQDLGRAGQVAKLTDSFLRKRTQPAESPRAVAVPRRQTRLRARV